MTAKWGAASDHQRSSFFVQRRACPRRRKAIQMGPARRVGGWHGWHGGLPDVGHHKDYRDFLWFNMVLYGYITILSMGIPGSEDMEVLYLYHIKFGHILEANPIKWPYIGLIYGRYLQLIGS